MPRTEPTKEGWQHVGGDGRAGRDSQHSAFQAAQFAQFPLGHAFDPEELAGPGMEQVTRIRESKPATGAVEQLYMKLSLQLIQRFGDGWLAEVQRSSGPRETALVDHGREQAQVVQVDSHYQKSLIDENNVLEL